MRCGFVRCLACLWPFHHLKQKNYHLGILTTEVFSTVKDVAEAMGFNLDDFRMDTGDQYHLLCAENVKEKKPSLEGFEKLIKLYGVDDHRKILYVGDSFGKDIETSLKTGLQAVHVVNSGPRESLAVADINGLKKEYAKINGLYALRDLL